MIENFLPPAEFEAVHREFFEAYDRTHTLCMMAQEAIEFREYFRCYVLGRERVRIMPYDPRQPFERRYVQDGAGADPALLRRVERDAVALCRALGYDFDEGSDETEVTLHGLLLGLEFRL